MRGYPKNQKFMTRISLTSPLFPALEFIILFAGILSIRKPDIYLFN